MLLQLHIQNIGLIDELTVNFREGLNILTGETGSGKSMIIGSIDALLGGDLRKSLVREADGWIEGLFVVEKNDTLHSYLEDAGLFGEELILSRMIRGGRSVFRCNGQMISKAVMLEIRAFLLDIHSQREHQSLLQIKNHMDLIDRYFSKEIAPLLKQMKELEEQYKQLKAKLDATRMEESQRLREIDFLEFEITEMEDADLKEGEEKKLEEESETLGSSKQIQDALAKVMENLSGDYGCRNQVAEAAHALQRIRSGNEKLEALWENLTNIEDILREVARDSERYFDSLDGYEERLDQVEKRLDLIYSMKAKYGNSVSKILQELDAKKERLSFLKEMESNRRKWQAELQSLQAERQCRANRLTEVRKQSAAKLEKEMMERLSRLNFNHNLFAVQFGQKEIQADGQDVVEFYISTNKGEKEKPLAEIASGGELSRIMLALKGIFANVDRIPCLIFDEIDSGISGVTAGLVGEEMKKLAGTKQIFAITHLPQIASLGDAHYRIEKIEQGAHTYTHIFELDSEARVKEIARLLGGKNQSKAMEETARELLAR